MMCAVCGAQNEAGAAFCYRCGSALKAADPSATGPTVNLERSDTPSFGSEVVSEESSARVYDVPESNSARGGAPVYDVPASNPPQYTPQSSNPPQYTPPQYGGQQQYTPQYNTSTMPQQSNTALIALILGIVSWFGPSLLTAIPAVILGRNARNEIRNSNGTLTGDGMAQAGIILGWINIGLSVLGICAFCALFMLPLLGAAAGG